MDEVFVSELFDLGDKLKEKGVFDSIINRDSRFFINILRLKKATTPEFRHSYENVNAFFSQIMLLLDQSSVKGDKLYKAALKMFKFSEVNSVNLGFSKSGGGSGIGKKLSKQIIDDAFEIVKKGSKQPEIFQLVGLFEENIAADRLSDMIASLVLGDIKMYTRRINEELNITSEKYPEVSFDDGIAINPFKKCELLYLPEEILHELPIAKGWEDVDCVIAENEAIRKEINEAIGEGWYKLAVHEKKEMIRKQIFLNPEKCARVISEYEKREMEPMDTATDIEYRVSAIFRDIKKSGVLDSTQPGKYEEKNSFEVALLVLDAFKDWIENNKGWEEILHSPSRQREKTVQRLIHLCGKSICEAYDYDFSFEPNEGPGPVDVKISRGAKDKTVVEIKLNSNPNYLHGFENQIETYKKAESTEKGIYVYIKVEEHSRRDETIQQVYEEKRSNGENCATLYIIDSTERASASIRV